MRLNSYKAVIRTGTSKLFMPALIAFVLLFSACSKPPSIAKCKKNEGVGKVVAWSSLKNWNTDQQSKVWPALLQSCKVLSSKKTEWKTLCEQAKKLDKPDDAQVRKFFEQYFAPHQVTNDKCTQEGVFTGYFVPTLAGSKVKSKEYKHAIYSRPLDMLTVRLKSLYPVKLDGMRLRGRVKGTDLIPYYSRSEIEAEKSPLKGQEIVWVKDPIALFFMHIQGSGYVKLPDGKVITVGYADQNGHPYTAIGRILVEQKEIALKDISLQSIRQWMIDNPSKQQQLMNHNPSYIFFRLIPAPLGALNVPLTAGRSIAIDRKKIPLGAPVWIETTYPEMKATNPALQKLVTDSKSKIHRLVMAQDTGGAIVGAVRADVFWGQGENAKLLAGHMNQKGKMFVLLPLPTAKPQSK